MIGILGGSGLYQMDGLVVREEVRLDTPFGAPSDPYVVGELAGRDVLFLPGTVAGIGCCQPSSTTGPTFGGSRS